MDMFDCTRMDISRRLFKLVKMRNHPQVMNSEISGGLRVKGKMYTSCSLSQDPADAPLCAPVPLWFNSLFLNSL